MSMKVESVVTLQDSENIFTDKMEFQMTNKKDAVNILFDNEAGKLGEALRATITFKNQLSIPLTELVITFEGSGLVSPTTSQLSGSVPAYGTVRVLNTSFIIYSTCRCVVCV